MSRTKTSRLAVRYFDDRILLSEHSAWAYFRLPTFSYEFTTAEEREALATNLTIALAAIRMQDAEIHLRIAHRTYPAADWALALDRTSDNGPGWREYLEEMYSHVWAKDFWSKEVYLGVRLGRRGVQLQGSAFFERLTAREQLHTFASLYGVATARADDWLERVGLTEKAGTRVEDLSGGQAQRLSIACALVHDPEVLFLDEPTASLDRQARRNLWDLLAGLHGAGRTVVLTTHHMDEAEFLCDRVAVMDAGRVLEVGAPAELVSRFGTRTLEDVFLHLTGREYRA